jgi:hypothetical protein
MEEPDKPELVLVRTPCPRCGAATEAEAIARCAPLVSCPASDMTDAEGFIVEATPESMEAALEWDALFCGD